MASIAEIKARLAAHAQRSNSAQASTGVSNPLEAKQAATGVVSAAGNAPVAPVNDTRTTDTALAVGSDSQSSVLVQQHPLEVAGTVEYLQAVNTDLQPTALTVVERPALSGSASGDDERELEKSTNLDVTNPIHQGFIQRLADLERALLERDPLMKTHLLEIHKTMIQYEEITNLLTIDEISKIMAAQQVHTNTILVKEVVKATAKKIKDKTAKLSLGDI